MSNVYTGIDLGTDSIKIIVCEKIDKNFHVLASVSEKSSGIKNGQVDDIKSSIASCKKALRKIDEMLGIKITKAIVAVPPTNCQMDIVVGSTNVIDSDEIDGEDIVNVLKDSLVGHIHDDYEIITAIPINFKVDDVDNVKDPKGMKGEILETKVVITTLPKEPLYRILEVLKLSGVETIDVAFTSTGDYYTVKSKRIDSSVGAIINIGELSTNVSVFNKGIQIKNSSIPVGSRSVDNDISYIFKTNNEDSRKLKEDFSVSMQSIADENEHYDIIKKSGEKKEISQVSISKVVEARIDEILKLSKNEIKNLTKREISYIIITGGLSELAGFQYIVDENFGTIAKVCNITTMGVRHNKYSSVLGITKYFDDKLSLRGKSYNMLSDEDIRNLISTQQKTVSNDNIINRVFGHFFDN